MSSLGKGYSSRPLDRTTSGKSKLDKEQESQEGIGSANSGRPSSHSISLTNPASGSATGQIGTKGQTGSDIFGAEAGKRQRNKQPARHALSASLREQILKRDHYQCRECEASPLTDKRVKLEIDHIVPVSRGGTNTPHNLQTLCHNCNQQKRASLT